MARLCLVSAPGELEVGYVAALNPNGEHMQTPVSLTFNRGTQKPGVAGFIFRSLVPDVVVPYAKVYVH